MGWLSVVDEMVDTCGWTCSFRHVHVHVRRMLRGRGSSSGSPMRWKSWATSMIIGHPRPGDDFHEWDGVNSGVALGRDMVLFFHVANVCRVMFFDYCFTYTQQKWKWSSPSVCIEEHLLSFQRPGRPLPCVLQGGYRLFYCFCLPCTCHNVLRLGAVFCSPPAFDASATRPF